MKGCVLNSFIFFAVQMIYPIRVPPTFSIQKCVVGMTDQRIGFRASVRWAANLMQGML